LTLFFVGRGVGKHNVISKKYHMSDITLISGKICDILLIPTFPVMVEKEVSHYDDGSFFLNASANSAYM
jgi:hypothetical protein